MGEATNQRVLRAAEHVSATKVELDEAERLFDQAEAAQRAATEQFKAACDKHTKAKADLVALALNEEQEKV